jgi:hypothetical protein
MTFHHDFGYFSPFLFPPKKKREEEKENKLAKIVTKLVIPFSLVIFIYTYYYVHYNNMFFQTYCKNFKLGTSKNPKKLLTLTFTSIRWKMYSKGWLSRLALTFFDLNSHGQFFIADSASLGVDVIII